MNRRGESGESTGDNPLTNIVMYIVFLALVLSIILPYSFGLQRGLSLKEDFYVKEIARIINEAEPNQKVSLDVKDLSTLAIKEKQPLSDVFFFDNVNHKVSVRASSHTGKTYSYFNDVIIINPTLEDGTLQFTIGENLHES